MKQLDEYNPKNLERLITALINWFEDQDIEPTQAAYICALVAGWVLAKMETHDAKKGVDILARTMKEAVIEIRKLNATANP